ncbi:MAG: SiaC family regulatory phosphoprotein [Bacteroidales bacterium]
MDNIHWQTGQEELLVYANKENGELLLSGVSYPVNPNDFFMPVSNWIANYLNTQSKELHFHLAIFDWDAISYNSILSIFTIINSNNSKEKVKVFWHYNDNDLDILEDGEELKNIAKFPFELVEHKNDEVFTEKKTQSSPLVYFDSAGDFILKGISNIDKPMEFYTNPLVWLNNHLIKTNLKNINFEVNLHSVSKSNVPLIKAILLTIDKLNGKGCRVKIKWCYSNQEVEKIGEQILGSVSSHYYFEEVSSE